MGFIRSIIENIDTIPFWFIFSLSIFFSVLSWVHWLKKIKRARLIEDVATSTVHSAPQGYIELMGHAEFSSEIKMRSPLSGRECVWFHYIIEKRRQNEDGIFGFWDPVTNIESKSEFQLEDETGKCTIDPLGAEVICYEKKIWYADSYTPGYPTTAVSKPGFMNLINRREFRFTERWIEPAETLYAIGQFVTENGRQHKRTIEEDSIILMDRWNLNPKKYLADFEIDSLGRMSDSEWNKIKSKAVKEVREGRSSCENSEQKHFLKKPVEKNNLYIISSFSDEELTKKYRLLSRLLIVSSTFLGAFSVWMVNIRF